MPPVTPPRYCSTPVTEPQGLVVWRAPHTTPHPTASAQVYTPSTDAWTAVGDMTPGRASHAATLLEDGRVLVTGGQGASGSLDSVLFFDPATDSFTDGPAMGSAHATHVAVRLDDGRVLVAGGSDAGGSATVYAEIYDPASDGWTAAAPMNTARYRHTATLLEDGRVLVVGQLVRVAAALAQLAAAVQTRHPSGGRGGTSFFGRGRGGRGR